VAETFEWRYGLDEKLRNATSFYAVFVLATIAGAVLDLLHFNPIKALYWTAIINGFLAPFLLAALLYVASDRKIMRDQAELAPRTLRRHPHNVLMFGAAIGMLAL